MSEHTSGSSNEVTALDRLKKFGSVVITFAKKIYDGRDTTIYDVSAESNTFGPRARMAEISQAGRLKMFMDATEPLPYTTNGRDIAWLHNPATPDSAILDKFKE